MTGTALASKATANAITAGVQFLTGVRAQWAGCAPSPVQRIYFANHTSHFDFLLILAALPQPLRRRTRPVAASDYWTTCAARRFLCCDSFRAVLIDRSTGRCLCAPLHPVVSALNAGDSIIYFPEGTRASGDELLPFKSGIFHLAAMRPEIDLVPVWLDNACRVMPKHCCLPVPLLCSATFGEPVRLAPGEPREDFLERLRRTLSDLAN